MKTKLVLPLLLACGIVAGYAQAPKSPLEGTWELTSAKWTENGKETVSLPGTISGGQLKMYSKGYFVFVGRFKEGDTPASDSYGGGTYTLNGEDYSETIQYHVATGIVGKTLHFKLVIKGDTMTLTGPITPENQKDFGLRLVEVYVRKD